MSKAKSTDKTRRYLESLTKDELIDLINKYAPPLFFENIKSQFAGKKEASTIFNQTSKKIRTLLSDEELLYSPSEFEQELLKQLERIRGLWDKLPSQIGDLIIKIIEDVEQAFEDGYLYIESYDSWFANLKVQNGN